MNLARRSSQRDNRKSARSAPVPGRSNIANQAVIETSKAHRRPSLAAAGDGHAPPAFRGSSGRESAPSKHRPQNNEPIHIGCHDFGMGSATVPVAVFGVAPKTHQTNLSNNVPGATPVTARETRALPHPRNCTRRAGDCPSYRPKSKIGFLLTTRPHRK
jgi:hypothetical protein